MKLKEPGESWSDNEGFLIESKHIGIPRKFPTLITITIIVGVVAGLVYLLVR